jgi:hypothetical protein
MSNPRLTILILVIACSGHSANAQADSTIHSIQQLPNKYIQKVDAKIDRYSNRLTTKTEKTLIKLSRWENKIQALLQKVNPNAASRLFANKEMTFSGLLQKIQEGKSVTTNYRAQYNEYRDNLSTSLKYIQAQKNKLDSGYIKPATATIKKMDDLEADVANSEATDKFIRERKKQLLSESVKYIGKSKYLGKINKESYYYTEKLKNYKEIFSDPKKAEETARQLLDKIPAFQQFMKKNSLLASLFGTPANYGSPQSLTGLQTRAGVNALIQERMAAGGPNARDIVQQQMQAAQSELTKLKDKLAKNGGSGEDLPDFKPNDQRSKTFLQRLEYGFNLQFAKNNNGLPSTADIGLNLGYKVNDKSIIGLGASYKMGMGTIDRIRITHQGIGLRSYMDWKLKKNIFISGGYELNHNAVFRKMADLKGPGSWQKSGLVGIMKKLPVKTKLVKNTKLQLLYDILHRSHIPESQPVIFRIGYSF